MTAPRHASAIIRLVIAALCGCAFASVSGCGNKHGGRPRLGMMPKLMGISYFTAAEAGAREAADELDVELTYDGPAVDRVDDQVKIIDRWIAQGYDMIAVAPNDPEAIAPALRRAKQAGVVVLTWDADANPQSSGRATFVNQAPIDGVANVLVELMAEAIGGQGKAVIITGRATAPNQNAWMDVMHALLAEKYPGIELLETLVSDEDQAKAYRLARDVVNAHPDLRGIWGITTLALPGAAKAVRDAGRSGQIYVTGLSLPNTMRQYVADGTVREFVLWNPVDLGYLTVHAAKLLADGKLADGPQTIGRLAEVLVSPGEVLLGPPKVFDRQNIDQYDF